MNGKKVNELRTKLEEIRASLMGDVAKNLKTTKEEFAEMVPDITDDATQDSSRQMLLNLSEQDWEKLKQVEEALENISTGNYGACQKCEGAIPEARLNIVPFAKYCVSCLDQIEKEERIAQSLNHNSLN
jgi:DnaK suppressor protein